MGVPYLILWANYCRLEATNNITFIFDGPWRNFLGPWCRGTFTLNILPTDSSAPAQQLSPVWRYDWIIRFEKLILRSPKPSELPPMNNGVQQPSSLAAQKIFWLSLPRWKVDMISNSSIPAEHSCIPLTNITKNNVSIWCFA